MVQEGFPLQVLKTKGLGRSNRWLAQTRRTGRLTKNYYTSKGIFVKKNPRKSSGKNRNPENESGGNPGEPQQGTGTLK
jgi:hypothetical protein